LSCFIPNTVGLAVVEEDRTSKTVVCNAVVSPHGGEVQLFKVVIEELEIEILSPRSGLWRFIEEQPEKRAELKGG